MCGIVSIFAYNNPSGVDRNELLRIRDCMARRGPDGAGEWYASDNRVGLGHRRLAIIDLSDSGAQPMQNEDGSLVITFNGEIYNYRELRSRLEVKGYRFKSTSDTEVLLHLYAEKGPDMVYDLRGMYAFVIWDARRKELFLARDPFGIKPLYYTDDGETFRAASQVKALLAGRQIDTSPEPAGHVGFFLWGHVPEPYTMYRGIRSLPAGTYLRVDEKGQQTLKNFYSIAAIFAKADHSASQFNAKEMHERLREALLDTVRHHLIADVPVGVFLSAGLDSSTLVALSSELAKNSLNTVTLGFREYIDTHDDETPLATLVAALYHTTHQTIWVSKEDFKAEIDELLNAMDQPTTDGVNSYYISKAAAKAGLKVALSGLGGDELFGSYPSFQQIPIMVKMFARFRKMPLLGKVFRIASAAMLKQFTSPKYAGLLEYGSSYGGSYLLRRGMYMPWELPELLDGDMVREGWRELQTLVRLEENIKGISSNYFKVSALEICWYMRNQLLRDTDWASMSHSLEVRVPMVDTALLQTIAPLLKRSGYPNKRDMARTPKAPLPREIINRGKTGFSVPVRQWLKDDLGSYTGEKGLREWAKILYKRHGEEIADFLSIQHKKKKGLFPRQKPTILIFRIGQLGDTLVAMPAIEAIRKKYSDYRMVLLTDKHAQNQSYVSSWDMLGPTGWFDDVIYYDPSAHYHWLLRNLTYLKKELTKLSAEYIFSLTPDRTKFQKRRDRFFFQHLVGISHYQEYEKAEEPTRNSDGTLPHMEPEWQRLLRIVGINNNSCKFKLNIPSEERKLALSIMNAEGIESCSEFLAIGPGSKMPAKRWPKERFAELGDRLLKTYPDSEIIILGGNDDKKIGDYLSQRWGSRSRNLAGKLSIYGSAAVLERCRAYVGNDTGTMHLAAMVGKPCVALFSARDYPGKWEPYGDNHIVLRHDTECAVCMLEECVKYNNLCMKKISIEEVLKAVGKILQVVRNEAERQAFWRL